MYCTAVDSDVIEKNNNSNFLDKLFYPLSQSSGNLEFIPGDSGHKLGDGWQPIIGHNYTHIHTQGGVGN